MRCSIRGDVKYGARKPNEDQRIHLHSFSLEFIHPISNEPIKVMNFPPNEQIWNLFQDAIADEMLK